MKRIILIAALVVACSKSKKPETTPTDPNTPTSNAGATPTTPTGAGTPCAQEIALVCPDGQIDGCMKTPAEGTTHACVAK